MNRHRSNRLRERALVHLRLARISNLPTVWADCVAAWALADGAVTPVLILMTAAVSLLYVGGMYLNDAFDAEFDAAYKPDRPIANLEIGRGPVFATGFGLIACGLVLVASVEKWTTLAAAMLLAAVIIFYDWIHKRISWSPFIMAGCRVMGYAVIAVAASNRIFPQWMIWSLALGCHVVGLSYLAKVEELNILKRFAPLGLLAVPPLVNLWPEITPSRILFMAVFLGWTGWCLYWVFGPRREFRRAVMGLIAGICLVDLMAASQMPEPLLWQAIILGCFGATLAAHKVIPGT